MTRINLINPIGLTDQHLMAEYKELTQVFGSLKRTLESKKGLDESRIPEHCTLNGGHVYFFYNKLNYLQKRYLILAQEMERRGFTPTKHITHWHRLEKYEIDGKVKKYPKKLYGDYEPTKADKDLIKERIVERIARRPEWYRYEGKPISKSYFRLLKSSK